jgi:hypothetical protein
MSTETELQNQLILDTIAKKILTDLDNAVVGYHHEDVLWKRNFHEDMIFEREIGDEDGTEQYRFENIFQWELINSELENVFDSLEGYSQQYVKDYVRDVYPDWRHCMD